MEEVPTTAGHQFHDICLTDGSRAQFGDQYFAGGLTIKGPVAVDCPTFAGSYSHSSLYPVSTYVQRPGLERHLHDQLRCPSSTDDRHEMRTVVVWGLGGSGKSQLVSGYVREHRQQYCAVFWIEAGQKETIERDYLQIYKLLFLGRDNGSTAIAVEDAITGVKSWLQGQEGRCLWVMDSADEIEDTERTSYIDLHHYLPEAPRLDRIITTRSSRAQEMSTQEALAVAEMSEAEAVQLFRKCAKLRQTNEQLNQDIEAIVKELGYLALAITLAGAYVHETPSLSSDLGRYLEEFQRQRKRLLGQRAHRLVHQYGESVLSTWETSFNAVQQQSRVAAQLLSLLAFLNFNDILLPLFTPRPTVPNVGNHTRLSERVGFRKKFSYLLKRQQKSSQTTNQAGSFEEPRWVRLLSIDAATVNRNSILSAFKTLQAYSLVSWQADQQVYRMHNLVHAWGHDRLDTDQQREWSLAVLELLSDTVHDCKGDLTTETRLVPHVMANFTAILLAYGSAYSIPDLDRENLKRVGQLLYRLGRWNDEHEVRALIRQATQLKLGAEHPDTLTSIAKLASTYLYQGRWTEAEELWVQVIETRKKVLGAEHPDTLTSIANLASTYHYQGRWTEAEELDMQVREIRKRVLGAEHPDTLTSIVNLAATYLYQGRWTEAEVLAVQVMGTSRRVLGAEHPDTLTSIDNLAATYHKQGRWTEAEELGVQVIEIRKRVLGAEHPSTLTSIAILASTYYAQGRWTEAEELGVQVIETKKRVLGAEHPSTLTSIAILAATYRKQGRWTKAEELGVQVIETKKRVLGAEHPDTLTSIANLVVTYYAQGRWTEAEELEVQVIETRKRVLGAEHPDTLTSIAWAHSTSVSDAARVAGCAAPSIFARSL